MKRLFTMVMTCVLAGAWAASAEEAVAPVAAGDKPVVAAVAGKVLAIKGDQALSCACGADCKCTLADDGKKCSCGKEVTTASVAGKFTCDKCCVIADKEGKCAKCGGDLKKVEKAAEAKKE